MRGPRKWELAVLFLVLVAGGLFVLRGCNGIADPAARETLLAKRGSTSFTVYPAYVRRRAGAYDEPSAGRLAEFLRAEGLAEATVSNEHVQITGPWHPSQPEMLRESADSFAAYLREHPIETDYALLAEYLFGGRDVPVGIHCYVLDRNGTLADAVLLNSHWPEFADPDPRTVEQCTGVLIGVLRNTWTQAD